MTGRYKKISVFEYLDYKKYLSERLQIEKIGTKDIKLKFSKAIGCHPSFLSQVLNGKPHLTIDQAILANGFLSHRKEEAKFFILLLDFAKASAKQTRDFFSEQISDFREQQFNLKKRFTSTQEVSREYQDKYYSSWYYIAIHLILMIPEYQNPSAIAQRFNLPLKMVLDAINFLEQAGLIVQKSGKYTLTKLGIYLDRESEFIQRHHINWRSQSLQAVEKNLPSNLHYSNVFAISRADFAKVKELFIQTVEQARSIVEPSKEESLYAIGLDIFEL